MMRSLREDAIRMFDDSYEDNATFNSIYGDAGVPDDGVTGADIETPATTEPALVADVATSEPLTLTGEQVSALNAAIATIQGILGSSAIETPAVDDTTDAEDDAATVNWGAPCRMPDSSEFEELYNKCDWSWKSNYNGTSGYLVTGPNGNTIFLPVSGGRYNNVLSNLDSYGNYWSRSLYSNYNARYLFFRSGRIYPTEHDDRYSGYPVRPVAE